MPSLGSKRPGESAEMDAEDTEGNRVKVATGRAGVVDIDHSASCYPRVLKQTSFKDFLLRQFNITRSGELRRTYLIQRLISDSSDTYGV